jgi:predicted DCC family thiol-disulfide oxidoreductase YuxK
VSIHDIRKAWDRFFFAPVSPGPMAIYRIVLGAVALANYLLLEPDLIVWFGPRGALPLETARIVSGGAGFSLFRLLPPTDGSVWFLFAVVCVSAFTLMIGLFSRVSAIVLFLTMVSFNHRDAVILNSGDSFLRIVTFFTIFSQCGAAYSVDRLIRIARGKESGPPSMAAPWAQRLIEVQVSYVYIYTFIWKAMGPMWLGGTALYYTSRLAEFWRFPVPYMLEHMWTIKFSTWGTLVVEFSLGVLVWIKEFRYWILAAGALLHFGIDYSMNIPLFAPIMVSSYLTFVDGEDLDKVLAWSRKFINRLTAFTEPIPLFYDGKCSFCARSVEVLQRLDVLHRFKILDTHKPETKKLYPNLDLERADRELLVRTHDGRWLGGFFAFRFMARHLPLGWAFLPLAYLPGVSWAGQKGYEKIAGHRYCLIPQQAAKEPAVAASNK